MHIYIEGDGQPFIQERYISKDPTSLNGVALKLIAIDPSPSILVGRPCYHQTSIRGCRDNKWWTSHRYSQEVVDALAEAIAELNEQRVPVIIIGHSGGASLAMLLAPRIRYVKHLVTISGNLDTSAWINRHSYTPLLGSLNPINHLEAVKELPQLHLIGEKDDNIPYAEWATQVSQPQMSEVRIIPQFTHTCCWPTIWPAVLGELNQSIFVE